MAYADLGGLGSKQGAPVFVDWAAPSMVPQVVPWLAILALLMLKPNRCGGAWWIGVPLACVAGLEAVPRSAVEWLPSLQFEIFLDWVTSLGFGLAALWLLSSYFAWRHRVLAFLGILLAQVTFGSLACAMRSGESLGDELAAVLITLLVSVGVIALALSLAGLVCRGRYGPLRLSLWLMTMLLACWALAVGVFAVFVVVASGGQAPVGEFLIAVPIAAGVTFGILMPFLVLAFANGLYRERLKALLNLGQRPAPPVIVPPARPAEAGTAPIRGVPV